ncbi:hypothetical protein BGZ49_006502, partial [Haplosporangium sp. Z 27]
PPSLIQKTRFHTEGSIGRGLYFVMENRIYIMSSGAKTSVDIALARETSMEELKGVLKKIHCRETLQEQEPWRLARLPKLGCRSCRHWLRPVS